MQKSKCKMQNLVLVMAVALAAFLTGGVLLGKVKAEDVPNSPPIVQKLVERFNLNKDEVTGVFDEVRQEHQQQRQAYMEVRIDEAVKDGVITAEQKETFLKKQAEWQEKQRQLKEEMRKWMEESGIDFEKLAPYRVGCGGRGFGRGYRFGGF